MITVKKKLFIILIFIILAARSNTISSYIKSFFNDSSPQLVLVLGGDLDREYVGANIAKMLQLPLIVSGGSNPEYAMWSMKKIGLKSNEFLLDYRAKDTFTNFTSLVDELSSKGISHAFLITSYDHLPRAGKVGKIIAGSRGIKLTNISVPCQPNCEDESLRKQIGDVIRSIVWVISGKDLKGLSK